MGYSNTSFNSGGFPSVGIRNDSKDSYRKGGMSLLNGIMIAFDERHLDEQKKAFPEADKNFRIFIQHFFN